MGKNEIDKKSGSIPIDWLDLYPDSLVVGAGPFTKALGAVFKAAWLSFDDLALGPLPNASAGYPRVFEELRRAFIVLGIDVSPAQGLRIHSSLWNWVNKIASAGDQHELAVVFILPDRETAGGMEESLAVGLGLTKIDPFTTGHSVWHQGNSFSDLVATVLKTKPLDLLPLKTRQMADVRRRSLLKLREAVEKADLSNTAQCAREVLKQFEGKEHLLDIFCTAPSHRHGNLLRNWLSVARMEGATLDWLDAVRQQLPGWIAKHE